MQQAARPFSTSCTVYGASRKRIIRGVTRQHRKFLQDRKTAYQLNRPNPVLGHHAAREHVYTDSKLASLTYDPQSVWLSRIDPESYQNTRTRTETRALRGDQGMTDAARIGNANVKSDRSEDGGVWGLDKHSVNFLKKELPHSSLQRSFLDSSSLFPSPDSSSGHLPFEEKLDKDLAASRADESQKSEHLARITSLTNASARQIHSFSNNRIISALGKSLPPHEDGSPRMDSGSPRVQAAVLTRKIRNLYNHALKNTHDTSALQRLIRLTNRRRNIFKHIRRKYTVEEYAQCLKDCGLEPSAVEDEVIVPAMRIPNSHRQ